MYIIIYTHLEMKKAHSEKAIRKHIERVALLGNLLGTQRDIERAYIYILHLSDIFRRGRVRTHTRTRTDFPSLCSILRDVFGTSASAHTGVGSTAPLSLFLSCFYTTHTVVSSV